MHVVRAGSCARQSKQHPKHLKCFYKRCFLVANTLKRLSTKCYICYSQVLQHKCVSMVNSTRVTKYCVEKMSTFVRTISFVALILCYKL